jgi:sugar lactone lactonase YvrE
VGLSPDGTTVFVTGSSAGDYVTLAYDAATGAGRWMAHYDGPFINEYARSLELSPDGTRVIVTGEVQYAAYAFAYATVAYDAATGAQLWTALYSYPAKGINSPQALGVSRDGATVFVTGSSWAPQTDDDYATVAYDAATGGQLWVARYNGPANGIDYANDLAVSPDGATVLVSGSSEGSFPAGYDDYATVAYDAATGTQQWATRYDSGSNDYGNALGMTPDGATVLVTGTSKGDYGTVAYDAATGTEMWVARYDGGTSDEQPLALKTSPDGRSVFITGFSADTNGREDYATVAYGVATGDRQWVARYDDQGHFDDHGRAVDVSPDGSTVFVSGDSYFSTGAPQNYVTLAYDAVTGRMIKRAHVGTATSGAGRPEAISISPDGTALFLTGWLEHQGISFYETVAYNLTP